MNQNIQPIVKLLFRLWSSVSRRRKWQFILLLVLMIFASFAEIISIGAVLPFLGVLVNPEKVFSHHLVQSFAQLMGMKSGQELILPLTIAFASAAIFAGGMRLLLLWASTRLSYATGADISAEIYRRTLFQPYMVHVARNSSEIINAISHKTDVVIHDLLMVCNLISAIIMMAAILWALVSIDLVAALTAFAGFGSIYILIILITRKKQQKNSERIARESTHVIKSLQEGLGGIRDVLIDGSQNAYCEMYRRADLPSRQAQGSSAFIINSPRYIMESMGMLLIAMLSYMLIVKEGGVASALPILGGLALGAQRLLPVLQLAYAAWSSILGCAASLRDALDLLEQSLPEYADRPPVAPMQFLQAISLNGISFRYTRESPWVLKNVTLKIARGARVGFIGTTGSGKSTLLDVVMGLLQPTEGSLAVDGLEVTASNCRAWQARVAHVPQSIFLADSSIEENIAFGIPKGMIDHQKVRLAAERAQIAGIVEEWPEKYQTHVGERGVRLSGGQRQRIGIARALYKEADVFILDEATSALDGETEFAVMQSIGQLGDGVTVLIIAHRLTTLKECDYIVELSNGIVVRTGSYQELILNR